MPIELITPIYGDNLHPNGEGYELLGNRAMKSIRPVLFRCP